MKLYDFGATTILILVLAPLIGIGTTKVVNSLSSNEPQICEYLDTAKTKWTCDTADAIAELKANEV